MKQSAYILIVLICLASCDDPLTGNQKTDVVEVFDALWEEVDRHYSFFPYQDTLDWDSVYAYYRPQIESSTEDELFDVCSEMLSELGDPHTNLYTNKGVGGSVDYFSKFPINELDDTGHYFSEYVNYNRAMDFGFLQGYPLAYLKINSFNESADNYSLEGLVSELDAVAGLIVDLRSNRGGYISNAREVLDQIALEPTVAGKYRYRNGKSHDAFSDLLDFEIEPIEQSINLPIVVLTNRHTFSAAEWFVLGAKALSNVQVVGDTTAGGSAIPLLRELPNGWILRVSNSQMQSVSGSDFQFTGIFPDTAVWITEVDAVQEVDAILEIAIQSF